MALNFVVTGVKMLSKVMDKKKMKEKAKKFVSGDKKEKREKVRNIMEGEKTESKKKISPTKLLEIPEIPDVKPAVSGRIDFNLLSDRLDNIVGMTDALGFLTETQVKQKKDELKLLEIQNKKSKSKKREKKLEKKDGLLGKASKGVKKAAQGPLDALIKFLTNIALGALTLFLIKNAKKIKEMFENIGENIQKFGKILRVSIFGFKEGMKLAKASFKLMAKGLSKLLSPVSKAFEFAGSKIFNTFKLLGNSLKAAFMAIPGMAKLTKLTSDAVRGVTSGVTAGSRTLRVIGEGVESQVSNITKPITQITSRGVTRAPSRLLIKLFGRGPAAKFAMKAGNLFKAMSVAAKGIKIPVIGPIIVAVTSMLAGEPFGKTAAKTAGSFIGGILGGVALNFLTAGTGSALTPLAVMGGEMVGEFLGDFFFELFNKGESGNSGGEYVKEFFGKIVNGVGDIGKAIVSFVMKKFSDVGSFLKNVVTTGFKNFTENFPTVNVPKIKVFGLPLGLQTSLGKVAKILGLEKYLKDGRVEKIPDLSLLTPMGIPRLTKHFLDSLSGKTDKTESENVQIDENGNTKENNATVDENGDKDNIIPTSDNSKGNVLSSDAEIASNSSSIASTTSAISSQASYEQSSAGTVILGEPSRSDFPSGAGGSKQFKQAMVMYNNQKAMLNSYYTTQVKASLYKV